MKVFLGFLLGVVVGVAGYWFAADRDDNLVRGSAQGSDEGARVTITGEGAKEALEEMGEDLRRAGTAAAEATGDAAITAAVKVKLAADRDLSASRINVDTSDGVVTLTGSIASPAFNEHAERLAKSVPGVKAVQTNLRVSPQAEP